MFCDSKNGGYLIRVLLGIVVVHAIPALIFPRTVHGKKSSSSSDRTIGESLAEKWAPLIWLAPGEKFSPLPAEEFLQYVQSVDKRGRAFERNTLPIGPGSEKYFLTPREDFKSLIRNTSFLNGRNPRKNVITVYTVVADCLEPRVAYWFFYPFNEGKEVCYIGKLPTPPIFGKCIGKRKTIGNHVGDYEHVTISFDENLVPEEMFLSVHDIGAYYKYIPDSKIFKYNRQKFREGLMLELKFPPFIRMFKGRPVLYSAQGSHGLWAAPGKFKYLSIPPLHDVTGHGIPWKTWKALEIYDLTDSKLPAWMKFFGKWGNPKSNCFLPNDLGLCEYNEGPSGIYKRENDFECPYDADSDEECK